MLFFIVVVAWIFRVVVFYIEIDVFDLDVRVSNVYVLINKRDRGGSVDLYGSKEFLKYEY